ncbi:MAG: DUF1264 domain-containing protein [Candidatus Eremiobacteraeota bacterium]|nr:DUF1264 domain-containing protein [Candidatus Eremiobacteraeota bacterium]
MRVFRIFSVGFIACVAIAIAASQAHPKIVSAAHGTPAAGWTIHIDAQKHFANHPDEWAHHWCRPASGVNGMLECQIYPSDDSNAPLVATEVIVPPDAWKAMDATEQASWHYHKTEIPKVNAQMPDVTPAVAKKMVEQITDTYGKVYVLWDPMDGKGPVGPPTINALEGNRP